MTGATTLPRRPSVDADGSVPVIDPRTLSPPPRVAAPLPAPSKARASKLSGALYLVGGVLAGGAITGLVLLGRDFGTKSTDSPHRATAMDAAPAAADLATPADLAPRSDLGAR